MRTIGFAALAFGTAMLGAPAHAGQPSPPKLSYGEFEGPQDPRTGMHDMRWAGSYEARGHHDDARFEDEDDAGPYDDDRRYDDGVTLGGGVWRGTWTGSYDGGPVREYRGEFRGDYDGPPPYDGLPPYDDREPMIERAPVGYGGGYVSGGYYFPAPTVTTVTVQSMPVTTTRTVTEYVAAPAWRPRHKWRARGCNCK